MQIEPLAVVIPVAAARRHDGDVRCQILKNDVSDPLNGAQLRVHASHAGEHLRVRMERGGCRERIVGHFGELRTRLADEKDRREEQRSQPEP